MLHTEENDVATVPYQPVSLPYQPVLQETVYQTDGEVQVQSRKASQQIDEQPAIYTADRVQRKKRPTTGAILALTLVIIFVFSVSLFAGWEFGRNSSTSNVPSATTSLPASHPQTTISSPSGNNVETQQEAAIAKAKPAVVQIIVTTVQGQQSGSGVIVDARGYVVTNNHVIDGGQAVDVVLASGKDLSNVQVVGTDQADDLAVLKIQPVTNMAIATLGDSTKLQVGQEVMAVGNPLGITQTVTHGIVSALNRSVDEQNGVTIQKAIQTDAPINPGNSGGALIDLQGNIIGIPTLTAVNTETNTPANGVGFAIPSSQVSAVLPQIIQSGSITQ